MKRFISFIVIMILLGAALTSCSKPKYPNVSSPFAETSMEGVDNAYLLRTSDAALLADKYGKVTLKSDGREYTFTIDGVNLSATDGTDTYIGIDAVEAGNSFLPKLFEDETELQLETNLLSDGTGEAVIYMFVNTKIQKAFPKAELEDGKVFSIYYEIDEEGRVVSVTYSKAVDRENFEILKEVMIEYE